MIPSKSEQVTPIPALHCGRREKAPGHPPSRPLSANGRRRSGRGAASPVSGVGTVTHYRWVAARGAERFPITMAATIVEVSPELPALRV